MAKKKQSSPGSKPPESQTISVDVALDTIMSTIQMVRAETNAGESPVTGNQNQDALRIMLAGTPDDYIIDTYYMVCGFRSLRELDLRIIRADMLVERAIRSFAESRAGSPKAIDELRYGAIRQFAKAMTEPDEDANVWVAARHLNEARNKVAHVLENAAPEIERNLVNFFKAMRVNPAQTPEEFEKAVMQLCQTIFTLKDNWIRRKKMNESIVRDFESGQLVWRK